MQPYVLFRNRMRRRNWALIGAGILLAFPLLLTQGASVSMALLFCGIALVAMLGFAAFLATWLGRNQIAELSLQGDRLHAEMLSAIGKGRTLSFAISDTKNWQWQAVVSRNLQGLGARTLSFDLQGRHFTLPLFGASIFELDGMRLVCPTMMSSLMESIGQTQPPLPT